MKDYFSLPEQEKKALIQRAYDAGYNYEFHYSNCGQCALAALSDVFPDLGIDDKVFKSAFGLGGGCGQSTMGTCGALCGAVMAVSLVLGRERSDMEHPPQAGYDAANEIYQEFVKNFDGPRCCDVQTHLFGRSFTFREEGMGEAYAKAGGHSKCGIAVGTAAAIVAKMIVDGKVK